MDIALKLIIERKGPDGDRSDRSEWAAGDPVTVRQAKPEFVAAPSCGATNAAIVVITGVPITDIAVMQSTLEAPRPDPADPVEDVARRAWRFDFQSLNAAQRQALMSPPKARAFTWNFIRNKCIVHKASGTLFNTVHLS